MFVKQNRLQTKFSLIYDTGNCAFFSKKNVLEKAKNINVVAENRKRTVFFGMLLTKVL